MTDGRTGSQGPNAEPELVEKVQELQDTSPDECRNLIAEAQTSADAITDNPGKPDCSMTLVRLPTPTKQPSPPVAEAHAEAKLDADTPNEPAGVLRVYEARKREIEAKREALLVLREECNSRQDRIQKIAKKWSDNLENLAKNLNSRFSVYMSQMACAGEVKLVRSDTDYKEWGLQIRVRTVGGSGRGALEPVGGGSMGKAVLMSLWSCGWPTVCGRSSSAVRWR